MHLIIIVFFVYILVKLAILAFIGIWAIFSPKPNNDEPYTSWHLTHEPYKIK